MQSVEMEISPVDPFTSSEASAISCVLEELLDQLALIGFMIPANVDPRWDYTFKTIEETYGIPDEPRIIFREDMGFLPIVPTEAEKMQKDRCAKTYPHIYFGITLMRKCTLHFLFKYNWQVCKIPLKIITCVILENTLFQNNFFGPLYIKLFAKISCPPIISQ